jgi:hypothetical protein
MEVFMKSRLNVYFLIIFALPPLSVLAMEKNSTDPELVTSPVKFYYEPTKETYARTVVHPINREEYTIPHGPYHYSASTKPATEEAHAFIASMQTRTTIQKPIFVFEDTSLAFLTTMRAFVRPELPDFHTLTTKPSGLNDKDTYRKIALYGHELGHLVAHQNKVKAQQNNGGKLETIWDLYDKFDAVGTKCKISYFAATLAASRTSQQHLPAYTANALLTTSVLAYGYYRYAAGQTAAAPQQEELFCNRYAVETFGNTPQEKIALIDGRIRLNNLGLSPLLHVPFNAVVHCGQFLVSGTHPSTITQNAQMLALREKYSQDCAKL